MTMGKERGALGGAVLVFCITSLVLVGPLGCASETFDVDGPSGDRTEAEGTASGDASTDVGTPLSVEADPTRGAGSGSTPAPPAGTHDVTSELYDGGSPLSPMAASSVSPQDGGASTEGDSAPASMAEHGTDTASDLHDGGPTTVSELACRDTAGVCDPVGECAPAECNFEETGKTCSYTPSRPYPFMCVATANYEPYRPCDADDVCAPGSVCISKVALLQDGSYYRRPGAVCRQTCREDDDCGEGEWCAQATDDDNAVIPDLRVCHRHCATESDCYEGPGDEEVRCSNAVEGAPPSTFECSRYRAPIAEPAATAAMDVAKANGQLAAQRTAVVAGHDLQAGLLAWPEALALKGAIVAAQSCVFAEDCPEAQDCVGGVCQQRCESPSDCAMAECVVIDGRGLCGATCEVPAGAECSLVPQNCGCGSGATCRLGPSLTPVCATPGPNGAMSWCNRGEDCEAGLSCIAGLCRPVCSPEASDCAPEYGECLLSVSRTEGDVHACGGRCDPTAPDDPSCGQGATCLPGFDPAHHGRALCAAQRPAQAARTAGQRCEADYDCAPGLGCDERGTCQRWCRSTVECTPGSECRLGASILGSIVTRYGMSVEDELGLCGAPP